MNELMYHNRIGDLYYILYYLFDFELDEQVNTYISWFYLFHWLLLFVRLTNAVFFFVLVYVRVCIRARVWMCCMWIDVTRINMHVLVYVWFVYWSGWSKQNWQCYKGCLWFIECIVSLAKRYFGCKCTEIVILRCVWVRTYVCMFICALLCIFKVISHSQVDAMCAERLTREYMHTIFTEPLLTVKPLNCHLNTNGFVYVMKLHYILIILFSLWENLIEFTQSMWRE